MEHRSSAERFCMKCLAPLMDMDPHIHCKSCRQPDPQEFYCAEDCEACVEIKNVKHLDILLKNRELAKLKKKLGSKRQMQQIKNAALYSVNKNSPNSDPYSSMSLPQSSRRGSQCVAPHILKERVMKETSRHKDTADCEIDFPGFSSSSVSNDLKGIESRLYEKIMSNIFSSIKPADASTPISSHKYLSKDRSDFLTDETSQHSHSEETEEFDNKPLQGSSAQKISFTHGISNEGDLDELISYVKSINPNSVVISKLGTDMRDSAFKVSSKASDILLHSTILSSPSEAQDLSKRLNLKGGELSWPANINPADLLNTDVSCLPTMKLHPKVRHLQNFLFGKLNPCLPADIHAEDFTLPNLSSELKNEFIFAREQLQRFLFMFSMVDYFQSAENCSEQSQQTLFNILLGQLQISMEKQANFLGLLIQEMRRDLLSDVECKDPLAVSELIMGPVHQSHFFGPYVKILQDGIAKKGPAYCLKLKSSKLGLNMIKLPDPFKEGGNVEAFLKDLEAYFDSNQTKDVDKVPILESLLPTSVLQKMSFAERTYSELTNCLKRGSSRKKNVMSLRFSYSQMQQTDKQSLEDFAKELRNLLTDCEYGTSEKEMLRDQFVFGLRNKNAHHYLMQQPDLNFEKCLHYALSREGSVTPTSDNESLSDSESKSERDKVSKKANNTLHNKSQSQSLVKRKLKSSDNVENIPSNKRLRQVDTIFYDHYASFQSHEGATVNIKKTEGWYKVFGHEAHFSYTVHCPWTGKVLRA